MVARATAWSMAAVLVLVIYSHVSVTLATVSFDQKIYAKPASPPASSLIYNNASIYEKALTAFFTGLFAPGTCQKWAMLFETNGSFFHPKLPAGAHGYDALVSFCETTRAGTPQSVYTPTGAPPADPVDVSGGLARFAVPYVWAANQLGSPIVNWGIVSFSYSLPSTSSSGPLIQTAVETWQPKTKPWNRQTQEP